MKLETDDILAILAELGIEIGESVGDAERPEIGKVREGETIYATSIGDVLGADGDEQLPEALEDSDERLESFRGILENVIGPIASNGLPLQQRRPRQQPSEPHCAWYFPLHFYGHSWGIYIREECLMTLAADIAGDVDWSLVSGYRGRMDAIVKQLLRGAFYTLFLHEQFHHKVESLGLRLLIAAGSDRYRPYKANVYRPAWGTSDCLEESLANAESYPLSRLPELIAGDLPLSASESK